MKEEKNEKVLPTIQSLVLRIAVGLYLLYIIYMLRDALQKYTGKELYFYIAAIVMFAVISAILLIHSGYSLIKGRYVRGTEDETNDADEELGEEEEEDE